MPRLPTPDAITELPRVAATDIKRLGWRGVMSVLGRKGGRLVVTNRNSPEAVILSAEEYRDIVLAARDIGAGPGAALEDLRHRFDERLAALREADAGDHLRAVIAGPAKLGGKVKAGSSR